MAEVDSLEIKIASDANDANNAIDSIIKNLGKLSSALKIDTSGLKNIGKSIDVSGITNGTKQIQAQAQKASKSLSQINEQYKNLGKGFTLKGSTEQIQKKIDSLSNKLENAKIKKQELEASGKTNLAGYENAVKDVIKYTNQIESLKNQLNSINEIKIQPEFANTEEMIARMKAQIQQNMDGVRIENPIDLASLSEEDFATFMRLKEEIEKVGHAASETGKQIRESAQINEPVTYNADAMEAVFGESARNIKNWSQAVKEYGEQAGNALNNSTLKSAASTKTFGGEIKKASDDTKKTGESTKKARKEIDLLDSSLRKISSSAKSLSGSIGNLGANIKKSFSGLKSVTSSILSAFGIMGGLIGIIAGLKKSIDISSQLTEVQNVVDVTFGNMSYKLEEFAKTSIEQFGMSELSLKQFASRFQSMGTAMGFPIGKMSDMSIELTKLTADMASFYNVEQDAVAEDLASVFTGTTRPLRQYGLDLTQATLQEWALKNGLDANIQSMSQAEKTMLRYQYVLANTGAAQGDFARTSGRLCAA